MQHILRPKIQATGSTPADIYGAAGILVELIRNVAPRLRQALLCDHVAISNSAPVVVKDGNPLLPNFEAGIYAFRQKVQDCGVLAVWDGASNRTIYGDPKANAWFRFVHDMGHMLYWRGFNTDDELKLHAELWAWIETDPQFWEYEAYIQNLVFAVYAADTEGQTMYESINGHFPTDQFSFVVEWVEHVCSGLQARPPYEDHERTTLRLSGSKA